MRKDFYSTLASITLYFAGSSSEFVPGVKRKDNTQQNGARWRRRQVKETHAPAEFACGAEVTRRGRLSLSGSPIDKPEFPILLSSATIHSYYVEDQPPEENTSLYGHNTHILNLKYTLLIIIIRRSNKEEKYGHY